MYNVPVRFFRALLPVICLMSIGGCVSPMVGAIKDGQAPKVLSLLDEGYDINTKIGRSEMTPLKIAVTYHRGDVAGVLLDRGADVNMRRNGTSALSLASLNGDVEMVALLLSKGAEVRDRDIKWAQGSRRAEIVGMLKKAAGDDSARLPAAAAFSDAILPSYKLGERPDDFALVIGVEKYMDAPEARFSGRDAAAMREHLVALGWPRRNILSLTGDLAGRAGISKYLEHWLPNNVSANSRIFFYFAGNGAVDPKTKQACLLPWDGDADLIEATGYPLTRLYEKLNALKAKEVIVLLDVGFTGAGPRSASPKDAPRAIEKPDLGVGMLDNVVALSAASNGENAGILESEQHGTLTFQFLKGLNGEAADARGLVTIKGLFRYVKLKVQEAARRENRAQTPQLFAGALGESDLRLR